jgi:beta-phosphoglucomutase-like phosphatase (HAD superfamily)
MTIVAAVVFDLDGVLIDSEPAWAAARRAVGDGAWTDDDERRAKGVSAPEWGAALAGAMQSDDVDAVIAAVVDRMRAGYEQRLPLLPGAVVAVRAMASRWPVGIASSANRPLIESVLSLAGLDASVSVVVAAEEVAAGKPAPDVYLEAARRLGADPAECVAVEDSGPGVRSAHAAGMRVVLVPNPHSPLDDADRAFATREVPSLVELTAELVAVL